MFRPSFRFTKSPILLVSWETIHTCGWSLEVRNPIVNNDALTSLSGLSSITEIGTYANIYSNGPGANTAPQNIRDATDDCRNEEEEEEEEEDWW